MWWTVVALGLGLFALAGQGIGLWEPVKPPPRAAPAAQLKKPLRTKRVVRRHVAEPRADRAKASREPTPGPPLEAGTAFMLALASALLALFAALAGTGVRVARHAPFSALEIFSPRPFRSVRPSFPVAAPTRRRLRPLNTPFTVPAPAAHARNLAARFGGEVLRAAKAVSLPLGAVRASDGSGRLYARSGSLRQVATLLRSRLIRIAVLGIRLSVAAARTGRALGTRIEFGYDRPRSYEVIFGVIAGSAAIATAFLLVALAGR